MYSSSFIGAGFATGAAAHATTVDASPRMAWGVAALRTGGCFRPFPASAARATTVPQNATTLVT